MVFLPLFSFLNLWFLILHRSNTSCPKDLYFRLSHRLRVCFVQKIVRSQNDLLALWLRLLQYRPNLGFSKFEITWDMTHGLLPLRMQVYKLMSETGAGNPIVKNSSNPFPCCLPLLWIKVFETTRKLIPPTSWMAFLFFSWISIIWCLGPLCSKDMDYGIYPALFKSLVALTMSLLSVWESISSKRTLREVYLLKGICVHSMAPVLLLLKSTKLALELWMARWPLKYLRISHHLQIPPRCSYLKACRFCWKSSQDEPCFSSLSAVLSLKQQLSFLVSQISKYTIYNSVLLLYKSAKVTYMSGVRSELQTRTIRIVCWLFEAAEPSTSPNDFKYNQICVAHKIGNTNILGFV